MNESITITTDVHAALEKVWNDFTNPAAIVVWNHASDDWHTTQAENDVREGGSLSFRMEAKDGSTGFDLRATYTAVKPMEYLAYTLEDGRNVEVFFKEEGDTVQITETFEPEHENTHELQRAGWQAVLDNFKKYAEQGVV